MSLDTDTVFVDATSDVLAGADQSMSVAAGYTPAYFYKNAIAYSQSWYAMQTLDSYEVQACASSCDSKPHCLSFNICYKRLSTQDPLCARKLPQRRSPSASPTATVSSRSHAKTVNGAASCKSSRRAAQPTIRSPLCPSVDGSHPATASTIAPCVYPSIRSTRTLRRVKTWKPNWASRQSSTSATALASSPARARR